VTRHRDFSEDTSRTIDEEVKKIVMACMRRAEKILADNMDVLHRLSNALLEREILDSDEIDKLLRGEELPPLPLLTAMDTSPVAADERAAAILQAVKGIEAAEAEAKSEKTPRASRTKKPQA
jgi:cell division protease FtsH